MFLKHNNSLKSAGASFYFVLCFVVVWMFLLERDPDKWGWSKPSWLQPLVTCCRWAYFGMGLDLNHLQSFFPTFLPSAQLFSGFCKLAMDSDSHKFDFKKIIHIQACCLHSEVPVIFLLYFTLMLALCHWPFLWSSIPITLFACNRFFQY